MEVYLTRICIDTMVKKGTSKAFDVDIKGDASLNLDEFKCWIKLYTLLICKILIIPPHSIFGI